MVPGTVQVSDERTSRPLKYQFIEHAERTAIYRACLNGISLEGSTLYQIWFPCVDCARAVIGAGIKEIVGIAKARALTPAHWIESLKTAEVLLNEAGVKITMVDEPIGFKMPFNAEYVEL
jgi:dCMP deaminase